MKAECLSMSGCVWDNPWEGVAKAIQKIQRRNRMVGEAITSAPAGNKRSAFIGALASYYESESTGTDEKRSAGLKFLRFLEQHPDIAGTLIPGFPTEADLEKAAPEYSKRPAAQ